MSTTQSTTHRIKYPPRDKKKDVIQMDKLSNSYMQTLKKKAMKIPKKELFIPLKSRDREHATIRQAVNEILRKF